MVLVDTSVLINYLKGVEDSYSSALQLLIDNKVPFGINPFILQEILLGARSMKEYSILEKALESLHLYQLKNEDSYKEAAKIMIKCRNSGVTLRNTIDCLIAQTAIENEVMLLCNDRDFTNMAGVIPELQLFEV